MRVLIVDDERIARHRIRSVLEHYPGIEHLSECADGAEAVERIREHRLSLVFLDVQLPELTGFEVIYAIGATRMPPVVFVTAFDEYAIRAFEVEAIDYLVKPFDEERLRTAFERARRRIALNDSSGAASLERLLGRVGSPHSLERLAVRLDGRVLVVRVHEIDWIESADNYVHLHVGGRSHLVRGKISALETRLDPNRFVRVHRSAIVNIERVAEVRRSERGESIVLLGGRSIPLAPSRREAVLHLLGPSI
jgi:two-component system LytT family response regulator